MNERKWMKVEVPKAMQLNVKYEEMLPRQFLEAVQKMPVFFMPTGLLEWHDNHLPLGLDALKAHAICMKIAEKIGGGIVLPPNYYGRPGYSSYIGTLTFSEACMDLLFTEMFGQLKKVGAKVIVVLTGHYGPCQIDFMKRVSKNYMTENPDITIIAQPEYEGITIDNEVPADHAGKWETSIFWHLYPELTYIENFSKYTSTKKVYPTPPNDFYKEKEEWIWKEDLSQAASPQLGERCVDMISSCLAGKIKHELAAHERSERSE
jgi:creatinine amidohydrolase